MGADESCVNYPPTISGTNFLYLSFLKQQKRGAKQQQQPPQPQLQVHPQAQQQQQ